VNDRLKLCIAPGSFRENYPGVITRLAVTATGAPISTTDVGNDSILLFEAE
jgi:hypothetical protein